MNGDGPIFYEKMVAERKAQEVALAAERPLPAPEVEGQQPIRFPCDSVKYGYVCERGLPHEPANLHAQLLAVREDGSLRVAMWQDEMYGVKVKSIPAPNPRVIANIEEG